MYQLKSNIFLIQILEARGFLCMPPSHTFIDTLKSNFEGIGHLQLNFKWNRDWFWAGCVKRYSEENNQDIRTLSKPYHGSSHRAVREQTCISSQSQLCTPLTNSTFREVPSVTRPWMEYLHHRNWKTLPISPFPPSESPLLQLDSTQLIINSAALVGTCCLHDSSF